VASSAAAEGSRVRHGRGGPERDEGGAVVDLRGVALKPGEFREGAKLAPATSQGEAEHAGALDSAPHLDGATTRRGHKDGAWPRPMPPQSHSVHVKSELSTRMKHNTPCTKRPIVPTENAEHTCQPICFCPSEAFMYERVGGRWEGTPTSPPTPSFGARTALPKRRMHGW
jgi:hypothetical protein